jgi:hypothetical protein
MKTLIKLLLGLLTIGTWLVLGIMIYTVSVTPKPCTAVPYEPGSRPLCVTLQSRSH